MSAQCVADHGKKVRMQCVAHGAQAVAQKQRMRPRRDSVKADMASDSDEEIDIPTSPMEGERIRYIVNGMDVG